MGTVLAEVTSVQDRHVRGPITGGFYSVVRRFKRKLKRLSRDTEMKNSDISAPLVSITIIFNYRRFQDCCFATSLCC